MYCEFFFKELLLFQVEIKKIVAKTFWPEDLTPLYQAPEHLSIPLNRYFNNILRGHERKRNSLKIIIFQDY